MIIFQPMNQDAFLINVKPHSEVNSTPEWSGLHLIVKAMILRLSPGLSL